MPTKKTRQTPEPDEPKAPWICESPPPEIYENASSDEEWPLEGIIAEEINAATGEAVYEVRWGEWARPDGSNTTWYTKAAMNEDLEPVLKEYKRKKCRHLLSIARESQSIDVYRYLDIHNAETWLAAQAYKQKLREFEERDFYKEKEQELSAQASRQASALSSRASSRNLSANRRFSSSASVGSGGSNGRLSRSSTRSQDRIRLSAPYSPVASTSQSTSHGTQVSGVATGPPRSNKKLVSQRQKLTRVWNKITSKTGAESVEFVNEVDDDQLPDLPPGFTYVESSYVLGNGVESDWDAFLSGCECSAGCGALAVTSCICVAQNEYEPSGVRRGHSSHLAYDEDGLLYLEFTDVYECNELCACVGKICRNRVTQSPRDVPIQVFKTANGKGWGARSTVDVPAGKILGIYAGTLLNRIDAIQESKGYTFDLDGSEENRDSENMEGKFSVDAYASGNWTRFINHSCKPNLKVINVFIDIPHIPYHTFVAVRDIAAGTEFTLDYDPSAALKNGNSSFSDSFSTDREECLCESRNCRGWIRG